jgi:hypothetical protein
MDDMIDIESLQVRVDKGEALFDEKRPGWYLEVDINTLDINDTGLCVLGQVYGNYWTAVDILFGGSCGTARDHGFDFYDSLDEQAELTAEWVKRINARL